jgi:hypothetical protein
LKGGDVLTVVLYSVISDTSFDLGFEPGVGERRRGEGSSGAFGFGR